MSRESANILFVSFNDTRSVIPKNVKKALGKDSPEFHIVTNQKTLDYETKQVLDYYDSIFGRYYYSPKSMNIDVMVDMERFKLEVLEMYDRYRSFNSLMLFDNRLDLYDKQLFFWYDYLQSNFITHVVFGNIPHLGFDYIIYNLCKIIGIPTLLFYRIPVLPGECVRYYCFENIHDQLDVYFSETGKLFNAHISDRSVMKYMDLRGVKRVKTFHGRLNDKGGKINFRRILRSVTYRLLKLNENYLNGKNLKSELLIFLSNRSVSTPDYLDNSEVIAIQDRKYFFMPLHFQPEASSAPLGGLFADQSKIISSLISYLPEDYMLVVKPHKLVGGHRQFFQRYKHSEKVKFVSPNVDSWTLMRNSKAVVTISGTLGWEAVLNSVPVLLFGSIFYQCAPGVFKIENQSDLQKALSAIEDGIEIDLQDIVDYLSVLSELTEDGWVDNRYASLTSLSSEQNLKNQTESVTKWLSKYG